MAKKRISVTREGMTLKQEREAYLYACKHERDFNKVDLHDWTGELGVYHVRNLKIITVSLIN